MNRSLTEVQLNGQKSAKELTKREYFAAMAMQGMAGEYSPATAAKFAVEFADALLKELETQYDLEEPS